MKTLKRWLAAPILLTITLSSMAALGQSMIAITPNSQTVELRGISGGPKKSGSCAGNIAPAPNHMIQVAEDTNLRITLQTDGQPALLIKNPAGQEFCVPAGSDAKGKIDIPGRWTKGTYSLFIGDRTNEQHSYTLSISRN